MTALWIPLEVADFDAAQRFYGEVLGLRRIDAWRRTGERGAVFEAGAGGRIEIVATAEPASPPPVALELLSRADVDDLHRRLVAAASARQVPRSSGGPDAARVFPRGHYGFVAHDPDGNALLIWSEK